MKNLEKWERILNKYEGNSLNDDESELFGLGKEMIGYIRGLDHHKINLAALIASNVHLAGMVGCGALNENLTIFEKS